MAREIASKSGERPSGSSQPVNRGDALREIADRAVDSAIWSTACQPTGLLDGLLTGTINMSLEEAETVSLAASDALKDAPRGNGIIVPKVPGLSGTTTGVETSLPPLVRVEEIFGDIARKAISLETSESGPGLDAFLDRLGGRKLRVGTVCSGTESPLLAMRVFSQALNNRGHRSFEVDHLFSCEIEPFKQSYIERNFTPAIVFRDVTDFEKNVCTAVSVYNAVHLVPQHLDLLVAGFSCKDFSLLNQHRKKLGEGGTSSQTFNGILSYCQKFRPRVVVLENIQTCPWDKVKICMENIGYVTGFVYVDTKHYYVPQTRKRGYLVAFDSNQAAAIEASWQLEKTGQIPELIQGTSPNEYLESLVSRWKQYMQTDFWRPASSPFFAFMLPDDDPILLAFKKRMSHEGLLSRGPKLSSWEACRGRYEGQRVELGLGFLRPITQWQNNGAVHPRDFFWPFWSETQSQRILEVIEISFLRKLLQRSDINYKTRLIEVSQNVDRDLDNRPEGIVGCILPDGQPFISTRGGPLLGRESLALQGLPVDELNLTRETNRELQDLAGNAMSSPVVGCAIISALMAGAHILDEVSDGNRGIDVQVTKANKSDGRRTYDDSNSEICGPQYTWRLPSNADLCRIGTNAARSRQLCTCEGSTLMKDDRPFFICQDCGSILCGVCKGNPRHNYVQLHAPARLDPADFHAQLRNELPPTLQVSGFEADDLYIFKWFEDGKRPEHEFDDRIPSSPAEGSPSPAEGSPSPAEGSPSPSAKPSRKKAAKTEEILEKMKVERGSLPDEQQYRTHLLFDDPLLLTCIERSQLWTISWESRCLRLQLLIKPQLSQNNTTSTFVGLGYSSDFEWLLFVKPHCKEPLGTKITSMLSSPCARMEPDRDMLTGQWQFRNLAPQSFNMSITGDGQQIPCWESLQGLQVKDMVCSKLQVTVVETTENRIPREVRYLEGTYQLFQNCGTAFGSLHKKLVEGPDIEEGRIKFLFCEHEYLTLPQHDSFVFAEDHGRLNWPSRRTIIGRLDCNFRPKDIKNHVAKEVELTIAGAWESKNMVLSSCSVPLNVKKMKLDAGVNISYGCHDTISLLQFNTILKEGEQRHWVDAAVYNISLERNPRALDFANYMKPLFAISTSSKDPEGWITLPTCDLEIGPSTPFMPCNICAPAKPDDFVDPRRGDISESFHNWERRMKKRPVTVRGTIERHVTKPSEVHIEANVATLFHRALATLVDMDSLSREHKNELVSSWRIAKDDFNNARLDFGTLTLTAIPSTAAMCAQPPSFIDNEKALRPEQLRSLQWMIKQEDPENSPFWHIAIEEACVPALNIRVEAEISVRGYISGGIVADEVGYGKTAVMLGLVDSTWNNLMKPKDLPFLETTATLIVVPHIILTQWEKEIKSFLGLPKSEFLTIRSVQGMSIEKIQQARIVLISHTFLKGLQYQKALARFSNIELKKQLKPGLLFKKWLSARLEDVKKHVLAYHNHNNTGHPEAAEQTDKQGPRKGQKKNKNGLPEILHFFRFKRLIVDEFTYLDGCARQLVETLCADSRWIISGTPDVSNFASVNEMACFIGARLGPDDDREGLYKRSGALDLLARDRTRLDNFQMYQDSHSVAWHEMRHKHAQNFLDTYARQNKPDIEKIISEEHFVPVHLTAPERVFYSAVHQELLSRSMSARKRKELSEEGLKDAVIRLIDSTNNGLEALIRSCSAPLKIEVDCQSLMKGKSLEFNITTSSLLEQLRKTFFQHSCATGKTAKDNPFLKYRQCITDNAYGDNDAMEWIKRLFTIAQTHAVRPTMTKKEEEAKVKKDTEMATKRGQTKANKAQTQPLAQNAVPEDQMPDEDPELDDDSVAEDQEEIDEEETDSDVLEVEEPMLLDGDGRCAKNQVEPNSALHDYLYPEKLMTMRDPTDEGQDKQVPAPPEDIQKPVSKKRKRKTAKDNSNKDASAEKEFQTDLRHRTNAIIDTTQDWIEHIRAMRYFAAIASCTGESDIPLRCSACNKEGDKVLHFAEASISIICGHVLCKDCLARAKVSDYRCPTTGCNQVVGEGSVVGADRYAGSGTAQDSKSTKLRTVVQLLKEDDRIAADDKIVIFVQYKDIADGLETELKSQGIRCIAVPDEIQFTARSAALVDDFKALEKKYRVCILRIDSPSAAGLNLQCANHVIFFSTLIKASAQAYHATMRQAIGRAKRFGQTKIVHVWHLMAEHTMDVNILQYRRQAVLTKTGDEFELVKEYLDEGKTMSRPIAGHEGEYAGLSLDSNIVASGDLAND